MAREGPRQCRWEAAELTRPEESEDIGRANALTALRVLKREELRAAARSAPAEPTAKRAHDILTACVGSDESAELPLPFL